MNDTKVSADYTPTTDDLREWYISEHVVSPELGSKEWADWLTAHDSEVASKALTDAADAWQTGGWANGLPKGADRVALILGMAQGTVTWLRARADDLVQP